MMSLIVSALVWSVTPPVVPAQFSSSLLQWTPFSQGQWVPGQLVYDRTYQRMKLSTEQIMGLAPIQWEGTPAAWSNWTQWTITDGTYFSTSGQIRKFADATSFYDMFGWVPETTFSGTTTINNKTVNIWELSTPTAFFQYYVSDDGTPVRQVANISAARLPGDPATWQNTTMDFMTFEPVAPPSEFSDLNTTAALYPPACPPPEDPTPVVLDMYIFHPSGENNISGQDTADAIGDAAFVCLDVLSNNTKNDNYSVVSLYSVEVYPQFGQYKQCNHYEPSYCIGAEPILVGREGGLGYGQVFQGQCTANDLIGSWYSLPPAGQCANGTRPTSPDVCTWRIVEKVKTIDVKCLFQRGMFDACKADVRLPFPKTTNIFVTAFEQDDPSKGGCPPYQE
eukprot:TRINITY_DN983_c0_g1_i2.p1 TRINITY_DN983_c0_g1~~TRINITY_DN983_c0_g1_i2.p1  ORF type:complete len:408 (+),score=90.44 TRINITY_DN983_c0_g1_i2:44-1225(+)